MEENNQIIIYQTDDNQTQIDVRMENDTVWLSTAQMAILFEREESNIRRHVINVFKDGELDKDNNVHFLHVNGVKKPVPFYNLDVIISVGYRVKSQRGVQFRQWANRVLSARSFSSFSFLGFLPKFSVCDDILLSHFLRQLNSYEFAILQSVTNE